MRTPWQWGFRHGLPLVLALVVMPCSAQTQRIAGPRPGAAVVAVSSPGRTTAVPASHAVALRRASTSRLVLGGLLGAAVGVLACNLISEAIEEVEDSSHCTTKGNLYFGIGGAAIGALIAALTG